MVLLVSYLLQHVTILPPSCVLHSQELAAYQLLKDKMHKTQAKENNMLVTDNLKDMETHICLRGSELWRIMLSFNP